jgi:hypothetical protein
VNPPAEPLLAPRPPAPAPTSQSQSQSQGGGEQAVVDDDAPALVGLF